MMANTFEPPKIGQATADRISAALKASYLGEDERSLKSSNHSTFLLAQDFPGMQDEATRARFRVSISSFKVD